MKIYCDNGACPPELKKLQKNGIVTLVMFPYENKNKHIKEMGLPSKATWSDTNNLTWETIPGTWCDYTESDKYQEIVNIVKIENKRVDILHLDSAYKTGCEVFITNDKDDIYAHRKELEESLNLRIFFTTEINELISHIENRQQVDLLPCLS